jgi:uncharacterized protein (TIGR02145 family)
MKNIGAYLCFTLLPVGFRTKNGTFMQKDSTAVFWYNLGPISNVVIYNLLSYNTDSMANISPPLGVSKIGFSVRCVRD